MNPKSCMTLLREYAPTRRDLLAGMIAAVFVEIAKPTATEAVHKAVSLMPDSRLKLIHTTFFAQKKFEIIPSDNSDLRPRTVPIGTVWTYPTDQAAIAAIQAVCTGFNTAVREKYDADPGASSILIGSNASNSELREIFGSPQQQQPRFEALSGNQTIPLAYVIQEIEGVTAVRYTGTSMRKVNIRRLISSTGRIRELRNRQGDPLRDGDLLGDDYLLLTFLPGTRPSTTVTAFSGLHAPATRSLDLLFGTLPETDLEELKELCEAGAYQAVFHLRGLREVSDGTTVGVELSLVKKEFGPVSLGRISSAAEA